MKETGLMFKAPLVRAILEGRKTQTRRIVKPTPAADQPLQYITTETGLVYARSMERIDSQNLRRIRWESPVGKPGDRIYVRETARSCRAYEVQGYPPSQWGNKPIWFEADGTPPGAETAWATKATPAIHLPMFAARIWLEVTSVRVERLQDISEEDAITEGIERADNFFGCTCWKAYGEPEGADVVCPDDPIGSFRTLWESTGGDWDANPWVWAVDFKVLSTTGRPA